MAWFGACSLLSIIFFLHILVLFRIIHWRASLELWTHTELVAFPSLLYLVISYFVPMLIQYVGPPYAVKICTFAPYWWIHSGCREQWSPGLLQCDLIYTMIIMFLLQVSGGYSSQPNYFKKITPLLFDTDANLWPGHPILRAVRSHRCSGYFDSERDSKKFHN